MTTLLRWWKTYGKAHVAAAGLILTWLASSYPDTILGHYAGLVVGLLTVAGVIAAPHKGRTPKALAAAQTSAGTVHINVVADTEGLLDSIVAGLHATAETISASKPKVKPAKKA